MVPMNTFNGSTGSAPASKYTARSGGMLPLPTSVKAVKLTETVDSCAPHMQRVRSVLGSTPRNCEPGVIYRYGIFSHRVSSATVDARRAEREEMFGEFTETKINCVTAELLNGGQTNVSRLA